MPQTTSRLEGMISMKTPIELFDYAKTIGAFIEFTGSYKPKWEFANANIVVPGDGYANIDGWSVFGRSEKVDVDEAFEKLAEAISEKTLRFGPPFIKKTYNVPRLKHTRGYRGRK